MAHENIVLELGESITIKPGGKVKGDACCFHITGGAAIVDSEEDLMDAKSLNLVGAQIGRSRVSYGDDLNETLTPEQKFAGKGATSRSHEVWDIEVVAKGTKGKAVTAPESPIASSAHLDGQLPMSEVQEQPSEKTPYGMDQENKPVAPNFAFTVGGDNAARQSEDAVAGEAPAPEKKTASKKSAKKAASKKAGK